MKRLAGVTPLSRPARRTGVGARCGKARNRPWFAFSYAASFDDRPGPGL